MTSWCKFVKVLLLFAAAGPPEGETVPTAADMLRRGIFPGGQEEKSDPAGGAGMRFHLHLRLRRKKDILKKAAGIRR